MSAPPFMPLYVGDYLADTTHLTCTEHGAYMLLLMSMWRNGGSLPSDDKTLARHARCTTGQWARMRPILITFFTVTDATITHGRLTSELTRHSDAVERQRERSSNGGKAKVLKSNNPTPATGTDISCQPEPEPEIEEAKAPSIISRQAALALIEDPKAGEFETWWTAYPAKIGKKAARKAWIAAKDRPALTEMLAALERYRASKPPDRDWCHPTTWLSQGRWDDDAPAPQIITMRPPHGKPDKLQQRHDNYTASWAGADQAAGILAARRAL